MELDTLGDPNQKTALFVIVSDTSATYNFIIAIAVHAVIQSAVYGG